MSDERLLDLVIAMLQLIQCCMILPMPLNRLFPGTRRNPMNPSQRNSWKWALLALLLFSSRFSTFDPGSGMPWPTTESK